MPQTLIEIPVYVKPDGQTPTNLVERIEALAAIKGVDVFVIEQGKVLGFSRKIAVRHTRQPLGIWGALDFAHQAVERLINAGARCIVHNLAPLYFGVEVVKEAVVTLDLNFASHVVGRREHIAASLSSDEKIGTTRALLECFFTLVGAISIAGRSNLSEDGFSGLQVFSADRYLEWDWRWVRDTKWGGALEGQLQSARLECPIDFFPVPHTEARTWPSSLGVDMQAAVNMLDQLRNLPALRNPPRAVVERALEEVGVAFIRQPWMNPATAADEIRKILDFYNRQTTKEPYLIF